MPERLSIAQVTPFSLEAGTAVGTHVRRVCEELARRGHRVLLLGPSDSPALVKRSRARLREDPAMLLAEAENGEPVVLGVGEVLPFSPARRRAGSIPIDVARTVEDALAELPLDVVHVHEPFAPSTASAALRHSHALNVATFHEPTDRVLSTQIAAPLTRLLFSRLDARLATYRATAELLGTYFPADYEVVGASADPVRDAPLPAAEEVTLVLIADEERSAMRAFLRALRSVPAGRWRAVVWTPRPLAVPATLSRSVRDRVTFLSADEATAEQTLARADVLVLASDGAAPAPALLATAIASGVGVIAPRLLVYEDLIADAGSGGLQFEPGDTETLAAQLVRVTRDPSIVRPPPDQLPRVRTQLSYARLAGTLEDTYAGLVARRHDTRLRASDIVRARLAARPLIDVDLHMHTDHSHDCATPVEVLLAEAKARGLGAIAVTDHNEISGALEAHAKATGIKVIVGEEVKTANQGEVIGLFLTEKIPRGLTLQETVAEIKRQGGLVYVPHPFDRMHSVPDYEHLVAVLDEVDAIEVFNPRIAISEFNEEAVRFAAKYRVPAGAGSDAHVTQGLGSVRIRMRDFNGPEEFLESLRDADIVRNPASLLYVQALKFLQTKALPPGARRASRDRRVRRAARNS